MKKSLLFLLSLVFLMGILTACGTNNTANSTDQNATEEVIAKSYQFEARYEESGEYSAYLSAAFLMDLHEDGSAVCDKYSFGTYDTSDVDTNESYYQSYLSGTWKEVEKDGVLCLQIKLAHIDETGAETMNETYYAYAVDGNYSFDMTFPLTPGQSYTRTVTMLGREGKVYTDDNDFILAYKLDFVAPESVGTFADLEQDGTAYLQMDGTLLVYAGYDKFAEGTWSKNSEGIVITIEGENVEVTMDGNKGTFTYSRSMGGSYSTDYIFVCEDITLISDLEASLITGSEESGYATQLDLGGNVTTATLILNDDGTAIFNAFVEITCNYETVGSVVVLSADGLVDYAEQIWRVISHTYLLNEDFTMTPVKNVYLAGDLILIALDDMNMKVEFPSYGMGREGFTYTLSEDGSKLSVTSPSEDEMGAFAQVWQGSGAENWTIEGNVATKIE